VSLLGGITAEVTVTLANSAITNVEGRANIDIRTIIPVLQGQLEVEYRNSQFRIVGRNITLADPTLARRPTGP
jgi:hypothetical protein